MDSHFDNQLAKLMSWGAAGDNTVQPYNEIIRSGTILIAAFLFCLDKKLFFQNQRRRCEENRNFALVPVVDWLHDNYG